MNRASSSSAPAVPALLLILLFACSPGSTGPGPGYRTDAAGIDAPAAPGTEQDRTTCLNGIDDDADGLIDCNDPGCLRLPECGGPPIADASTPDAFDECRSVDVEAMTGIAPVDIIWVVDSSGSMGGEARIVQDNMNNFSSDIGRSGIDYHVVVMTDPGYVHVPAPLGTDTERFRAVNQGIGSHAALSQLVAQFARYSDFLRPTAVTHFVIVTDDETELGPSEFRATMEGLLGHSFTVHSIASPPGSDHCVPAASFCLTHGDGCSGPNGDAADNGDRYWSLSDMTGGEKLSICTADWSGLFRTLSAAIAVPTPLPCVFELPDPPEGMELDPMRVNLVFTTGAGATETLPYVTSPDRCGAGGWYYDDPAAPSSIVVCPETCDRLEADLSGRVDIALGCATMIF